MRNLHVLDVPYSSKVDIAAVRSHSAAHCTEQCSEWCGKSPTCQAQVKHRVERLQNHRSPRTMLLIHLTDNLDLAASVRVTVADADASFPSFRCAHPSSGLATPFSLKSLVTKRWQRDKAGALRCPSPAPLSLSTTALHLQTCPGTTASLSLPSRSDPASSTRSRTSSPPRRMLALLRSNCSLQTGRSTLKATSRTGTFYPRPRTIMRPLAT